MGVPDTKSGGAWWGALALVALVALGGAVVWSIFHASPTPPVQELVQPPEPASPSSWFTPGTPGFAPVPIHVQALRRAIDEQPMLEALPPQQLQPWSQALKELHLAELRLERDKIAKLEAQAELQAREFYGAHQAQGTRAALKALYPPFRDSLRRLHQAATAKQQTLAQLWEAQDPAHLEDFARLGSFLEVGAQLGLIDATGAVSEDNELLVEIFYRYRLARMLQKVTPVESLLCLEELRLFHLWRLHQVQGLELGRRMRYIQKVAELVPGYPTAIAQGVVFYQAGRLDDARVALERAQKLQPSTLPLVQSYLEHLQQRSQPPSPPAEGEKK